VTGATSVTAKVCATCGESSEPQFDVCWSCGGSLPEATQVAAQDETTGDAAPVKRASPIQMAALVETLAVLLIAVGYPIVEAGLRPATEQKSITAADLYASALAALGWILLLIGLLTRDADFRWNLPSSWRGWLKEAGWGAVILGVAILVEMSASEFAHNARWLYYPTTWRESLAHPGVLTAFRLTAPFVALREELLMRVYLQHRMRAILGGRRFLSVPICAYLFAAMHGYSPVGTAMVFGFGIVLGSVYEVTRKVPRLVVAHTLSLLLHGVF